MHVISISSVLLLPAAHAAFCGRWVCGSGLGDADTWLQALDTARAQFSPNPLLQDISLLYDPTWNGFVEGPTWGAWWTQNSYGTTFAGLPFMDEPLRSFVRNANWMWFEWIGNGTRVGLDDPNPAPDGCLCDAATPNGAYYKQGDGNVPIHDWALEESLSGVIMQAEQLIQERDPAALALYLPLLNRTLHLIETRRNATLNVFYSGDSCNLLAPSYGAWLQPNGSRIPAFLTGMSVSYIAALDRVIEAETLAGGVWTARAAQHAAQRDATLEGLPLLLAPSGDYFVKWMDPNGTLHGVLGQAQHGYFEAVVNHDAIAMDVAERVRPGLSLEIMDRMLSPSIPPNPVTGGPGLRPYSLVITNAASLDDMEIPPDSWLWSYGTWVNGGEWATCEARMMLAYFKTGMPELALESMQALLGFASIFRMDSPLVNWGSAVYQPSEPINIVYDMFAIPAALIRGMWDPVFTASALTLRPHIPGNLTNITFNFPIHWGPHSIYVSSQGNSSTPLQSVVFNGSPLPPSLVNGTSLTLPWTMMPSTPCNCTLQLQYPTASALSVKNSTAPSGQVTRRASVGALQALIPSDMTLWIRADDLKLGAGTRVSAWPDAAPASTQVTQSNVSAQPVFWPSAMNGNPAVQFDGVATFMQGMLSLPTELSVAAVFVDAGESNDCCTGIFYSAPGCGGFGTKYDASVGTVTMIDWSGSPDSGVADITGHQTVATVTYNSTGAYLWADGCLQSFDSGVVLPASTNFMVGTRNNELGRYFRGNLSELIVWPRALNTSERQGVEQYLTTKWPRAGPALSCNAPLPNCTLPPPVIAANALFGRFSTAMTAAGFTSAQYELAHSNLILDRVITWQQRCAGLQNGTITPLAQTSEQAADAMYVSIVTTHAQGLTTVLQSYANATDPTQRQIYAVWLAVQ